MGNLNKTPGACTPLRQRPNQHWFAGLLPAAALLLGAPTITLADGDLHKVNHIIVVMQENHSFDNYFGALAYAPGSPGLLRGSQLRPDRHGERDRRASTD
jgi:phospholipase C